MDPNPQNATIDEWKLYGSLKPADSVPGLVLTVSRHPVSATLFHTAASATVQAGPYMTEKVRIFVWCSDCTSSHRTEKSGIHLALYCTNGCIPE